MNDKEYIIKLLEEQNKQLEIENALLRSITGKKTTKKKRMKSSIRRKLRHLKLIAVNGVPIHTQD